MMKYLRLLAIAALLPLLPACDQSRIYEQNVDIPENNWAIDNAPEFTFQVQDVSRSYDIYFNVRNAVSYDYYNLYIRHYLLDPDGKQLSSQLHELYLMDKKTGEPRGKGSGDMFDHQVRALRNVTFSKPGEYRIRLKQYMRRDPLPGIISVGVKVSQSES